MHRFLSSVYLWPAYTYIIIAAVAVIIWTFLLLFIKNRKLFTTINAVVFTMVTTVIIYSAFFIRDVHGRGFSLIPFQTFISAQDVPELYNEALLNVLVFVPLGMTFPFLISNKTNHPVLITLVFTLCLSIMIECIQYVTMTGYAEIDDVIFNTFGAFIGTLSYTISRIIKKKCNHASP